MPPTIARPVPGPTSSSGSSGTGSAASTPNVINAAAPGNGLTAVTLDGTGDNGPALQAQANYARTTWGGGIIRVPLGTVRATTGITLPPGVELAGTSKQGTVLDFSQAPATIVAVTGGSRSSFPVRDCRIVGPNGFSKINYVNNGSVGVRASGIGVHLARVAIECFGIGVDLTNADTYFFHGDELSIGYCGLCIDLNCSAANNGGAIPPEVGERMLLTNSVLYNSQVGFDIQNSGVTLFVSGCSLDYLGKHGRVADGFLIMQGCHLETGYAPAGVDSWGSAQRWMIEALYNARLMVTGCRFEVREAGVYAALSPDAGPYNYNGGFARFRDCTWYGVLSNGQGRQYQSSDMVQLPGDATTELAVASPFLSRWGGTSVRAVAVDGYAPPAGHGARVKATTIASQAVTLERTVPPGAATPYPALWVIVDY